MTGPNDATQRQVQAADPRSSTWLAANAGSGKTRVLTDRVARLLLNGVQPQHILCLTYTKAAASEMQNRLFKRLGSWSMLDDETLNAALEDLGVHRATDSDQMAKARTLFARAIETPGGLKIQTIHSFCASLLRRFPLEAGVSPQFSEMEDRAAVVLRAEIVDDFSDGPNAHLIDAVAPYVAGTGFDDLTTTLVHKRTAFETPLGWSDILAVFDLPADFDDAKLRSQTFLGGESALLKRLRDVLEAGKAMDVKAGQTLANISDPGVSDLPALEKVFLTGAGAKAPFSAKLGTFPTKDLQKKNEDLIAELQPFMERVENARAARLGLAAARKSHALHRFAEKFLPEYARRKQLRGWLDFDDLILKSRHLLNDPSVAAWVLYRLDGGIDHILVDEAQDTSPAQWDVIEKLAQEFTSGAGARSDVERTIFVVGDKKQSIYSFQGADPDAFDRMQDEFANRLRASDSDLHDLTLEYSFRSSEIILQLVDTVFAEQSSAGFHKESLHRAFKSDLPGRVDLWPVIEKVDDTDEREWTDPVDRPGVRQPNVILAEQIARSIKQMIDTKVTIPTDTSDPLAFARRGVEPGDFLILVQRRSDLFAEIIRACKSEGLPIAGADRLKVGAELAVKDLGALLAFLDTPEDSLSLATVLKSPLLGWSEQALFDLAHRRDGPYLWQALRDRGDEFPETMAFLNDLRDQADFLRPYDLIERVLTRHDGRRRLLGRLGAEAEDGINALLSQALAYERSDIPSLTGFLVWMQTDDLEIKRQMDGVGNMIRVMTVHGAKGLEAPIVILPDTGPRPAPRMDDIMMSDGLPLWQVSVDQMPNALLSARDGLREKQMNERLRLLYVALTRAEKWLIVAAAGDLDKSGDSWYQKIQTAMVRLNAENMPVGANVGLRLEHGDWHTLPTVEAGHDALEPEISPSYFDHPVDRPDLTQKTLSPSDLGGAKALLGEAGQDEATALARGTRLHVLLELLPEYPQSDWAAVTHRLLPDVAPDQQRDLLHEATGVLIKPDLEPVFASDTLAEVPITAAVHGQRIHGIIDRLIILDDRILAIDFKTNMTVPTSPKSCPDGILRQMGAYELALMQIYPGKVVETAILWTRTADLMILPHDIIVDALLRSPRLDDIAQHS